MVYECDIEMFCCFSDSRLINEIVLHDYANYYVINENLKLILWYFQCFLLVLFFVYFAYKMQLFWFMPFVCFQKKRQQRIVLLVFTLTNITFCAWLCLECLRLTSFFYFFVVLRSSIARLKNCKCVGVWALILEFQKYCNVIVVIFLINFERSS